MHRLYCGNPRGFPQCGKCEKFFTFRRNLDQHILICGIPLADRKSFKCTKPNCTESFVNQSKLDQHLKIGGIPLADRAKFECPKPDCTASFMNQSTLDNHLKICGIPLADRAKFECSKCHTKFTRKDALTRHLKTCKAAEDPKT